MKNSIYMKRIAGATGIIVFVVVTVFGAITIKQQDPRLQLAKNIAHALRQSIESQPVQMRLDDLMVTLVKEAGLNAKERKALLRMVSALKLYEDQRWLFDALQLGSERNIQEVADALNMPAEDIKQYDEKEQAYTEGLREGELDPISYELMIKKLDKDPRYAKIKAVHKGVKDASLLLKVLDDELPESYVKQELSRNLARLIHVLE